jgi:hypothetical protein
MVSRGFCVYDMNFFLLDIFLLDCSFRRAASPWTPFRIANVAEDLDIYRRAPFFVVERKHICNYALPYCHARGLETSSVCTCVEGKDRVALYKTNFN